MGGRSAAAGENSASMPRSSVSAPGAVWRGRRCGARLRKAGDDAGTDAAREEMNLLARQLDAFTADEKRLPKAEQALVTCVRHMNGLAQARADIATLRAFAGKPAEGELSPEEWRGVQEFAASGFEQYLSEGKAPTLELEGVFDRMLKWLKSLYALWRDSWART